MNEIKEYTEKLFEDIKHVDKEGNEYWLARELMPLLEYSKWERFSNAIDKAKEACKQSGYGVNEHFPVVGKLSKRNNGANVIIKDYKLSRYACYLVVQSGDSKKKAIALGQTYFAIQTRKQELNEKDYSGLTEEQKRFYQRNLTRKGNSSLNIAAKNAGVKNFDKFHNAGYMGLYNGETARDIAKRKNLGYREDILDNMCSDELIVNLFRISQTDQRLRINNIKGESNANQTHYVIGKNIREVIIKNGGIMPEDFITPDKSLKELERENKKLGSK